VTYWFALLAVAGLSGPWWCSAAENTVPLVENRPPELKPIGPQIVDEGEPLAFPVVAVDPEDDPLEFELSEELPEGATFEEADRGRGEFAWTPRWDQSGEYHVTFTIRERLSSVTPQEATEQVKITVNEKKLAISGAVWERGSGLPFKDITVQLITTTPVGEPKKVVQEVKTDTAGRFLFIDIESARYRLKALPKRPVAPAAFSSRPEKTKARTIYFTPSYHVVTVTDKDQLNILFEKAIR
jgi:hypothetical protein